MDRGDLKEYHLCYLMVLSNKVRKKRGAVHKKTWAISYERQC